MTKAPLAPPTTSRSAFSESLGLALIAAGRQAQSMFDDELARLGLTMRHLGALGHLARDPHLSISDLARRSGVTAQSMHATLRGLEERGAAEILDQGRGRPAHLAVTDLGRDLLDQSRAATASVDQRLTELLGAERADAARAALAAFTSLPRGARA